MNILIRLLLCRGYSLIGTRAEVKHLAQNYRDHARVVLYKGGKVLKELKFNAQGSDKLSWFSISRLTQSPWSDIKTQPKNYFSILGSLNRYFFINSKYGGCPVDAGWLVVTANLCSWEKHFNPSSNVRAILYSKLSGLTNWNRYNNIGVADTLVVYLR